MNRAAFLRLLGLAPLAATLKPKAEPLANLTSSTLPESQPEPLDEPYGLSIMEQMDERHRRMSKAYSMAWKQRNG